MNKVWAPVLFGMMISASALGQWKKQLPAIQKITPPRDIVCYGNPVDQNLVVEPPQAYLNWKRNSSAKTQTATFEVTYINFPTDAQAAFQKAVDIWSTLIESNVPIRITAVWQVISGAGVLGGATPGTYIRDFDGAQRVLTWYPVALAEKMANQEFNDADEPDVFAQFNSAYPNWSFDVNGIPQSGKTDLVTVVLHEIGHGLGITRSYNVEGDNGTISSLFSGLHVVYDHFIENTAGQNFVQNFPPPSAALKTQLTSANVWFKTPQLPSGTPDNRAFLFAPGTFQTGSSIAHLDESTYSGTPNALMTPQVGTAEVLHNPGPITMKMLADQGWVHTRLVHTRLPNTENVSSPYEVKVVVLADQKDQTGANYGYNSGEVKLNYTSNGTTFTMVTMTATGTANEFSATIPNTGAAIDYGYYITVKDNLNRTISKPGILAEDGEAPSNFLYFFSAGPDNDAPFINHTPQPFLQADETELEIEAIVSDNIGISEVMVDYQINGTGLTSIAMALVPDTDSTYLIAIPLPALTDGDKVEYRIRAKDSSVAQNTTAKPSTTGFIELNVVSLAATQTSYINNFNTATSDFFGDAQFNISTPTGFTDGAIHTIHPYPVGTGSDFTSNFIYQLRIPIKLNATDATLKFDEIVLVEPGESGSVFGDEDFWDYVIVEGSKDGGTTWKPMAAGYDSRDQSVWLSKFNSSVDANNNSTASGDPTLFRTRTIDMLATGNFSPNDEVVIRFRLLTDQLVVGWGWAIDNLKIQVDDVPPTILHNHTDYLQATNTVLSIPIKVTDASGLDELFVDYKVNNGAVTTESITIIDGTDNYTLEISFIGLSTSDKVEYRIRAKDTALNEAILPGSSFFQVPIISFGTPVSQYVNNFNSVTSDFVGNFFTISQPSGFSNSSINSPHPYLNGFGITNNTSTYTFTLTKPITISTTNPYILFDEVAIIEYSGSTVKDMVVVEGSKDNGATWHPLLNAYAANAVLPWKNAYDAGSSGSPGQSRARVIDITASGDFDAGDNILVRFKLTADGTGTGWGWSIDNLSIQGPVTGVEANSSVRLSAYPNPVKDGTVTVEVSTQGVENAHLQITNTLGAIVLSDKFSVNQKASQQYSIENWSEGIYLVRVRLSDGRVVSQKLVKSNR